MSTKMRQYLVVLGRQPTGNPVLRLFINENMKVIPDTHRQWSWAGG